MQKINEFIKTALAEDIGTGDVTTLATIYPEESGEAVFYVKQDCIIAGIELAKMICAQVDAGLVVSFNAQDGDFIKASAQIGSVKGTVHAILKAERVLLNAMQRMSAIATKTRHFVSMLAPYKVQILDTRKTTPNFRICEKWAVRIGGGVNHRFGLYDQVLIKDNHIKAAGGIQKAIESCEKYLEEKKLNIPVVVEVKNIEEFNIAKGFAIIDRVLVDNFKPENIKELLLQNDTKKIIEASGGINESNIIEYAKTGVDFISLGDLTHHVAAVDISLKIV